MDPLLPEPNGNGGNANSAPQDGGTSSVQPQAPPVAAPQSALPQNQPMPTAPQPLPDQPMGQVVDQSAGSTPLIADDVDVIEKEWVEKAKKIVDSTKSDPHQLEKEVSKLQADYLMKRYNKKLKVSE